MEARKSVVFRCVVFSTKKNSGLHTLSPSGGNSIFHFWFRVLTTSFACPGPGARETDTLTYGACLWGVPQLMAYYLKYVINSS